MVPVLSSWQLKDDFGDPSKRSKGRHDSIELSVKIAVIIHLVTVAIQELPSVSESQFPQVWALLERLAQGLKTALAIDEICVLKVGAQVD